jgi:peptide/nickel transport system ATP-binding protein
MAQTTSPTSPSGRQTAEQSGEALLDIRELYIEYFSPRGPVRAVDGVSFSIAPGEVFGLAGESGSGKSTIAHALLRVLRPPAVITGGEVLIKGDDVLKMEVEQLEAMRWRDVAMVFQSAMNSLNPVTTISTQITDVLMQHQNLSKQAARRRAEELFDIVNIDRKRLDSYPHELSGGMRQRAVIAIALALHAPLLIMDEPTTALDVVVQKDILQQIQQLKEELGFSILFITHDLSLMVEFSNRIGVMYAGQIVELAEAKELYTNPLHPYTQGLLSSFPPLSGPKRRLAGIPGSPPDMANPPSGCRFHPRCTLCNPLETKVQPTLHEVRPGHWLAYHDGMPLRSPVQTSQTPQGPA